jgi:hypothetical protein
MNFFSKIVQKPMISGFVGFDEIRLQAVLACWVKPYGNKARSLIFTLALALKLLVLLPINNMNKGGSLCQDYK